MHKLIAHAVAASLALFTLSDGPVEKAPAAAPPARTVEGGRPEARPAEPARAAPATRAPPAAPPTPAAKAPDGGKAADPKPCEPVKPCAID